jgi:hypothetical protein
LGRRYGMPAEGGSGGSAGHPPSRYLLRIPFPLSTYQ